MTTDCRCFVAGLLLLLVSPITAYTQKEAYILQQLDNRNGLSNSAVNCVFQDSDDMLWVGTWDGLNRYDGKGFHVFNYNDHNNGDQGSIGSNIIQHIVEDQRKNIWISTMEGISRYSKKTGGFHHYFYTRSKQHRIREQEFEVAVDTGGMVFARTAAHGLACYDAQADTFASLSLTGVQERIHKILFDAHNRLWVLSGRGMIHAFEHTSDRQFKPVYVYNGQDRSISDLFFVNGQFFFSTSDGTLYQVGANLMKPKSVASTGYGIKAMTWYNQHYYVAMVGQGYLVYNANFGPQASISANLEPLETMKVTAWSVGNEQLLWAATDGNGILKIAPQTIPFASLSPAYVGVNKPVRAICEIDGSLWVGTKGGGISSVPDFDHDYPKTPAWKHLTANGELSNNSVYTIRQGSNELVYIGTDGKGLSLYDQRTSQFLNWADLPGHAQCPDFGSVYAVREDPDGSIWLGTSGFGLLHLRFSRLSSGRPQVTFIQQYNYSGEEGGLANDIIYAICPGDGNDLWIACRYGGLSLLNRKSGEIKTFKAFTYEGSLSNNDVLSLYKDSKNRLWVGTSYGLNWISLEETRHIRPQFKSLTTSNGLPNNTIHAISEDDMGYIWVSTNKGLAKINPADISIAHYQETDGLQSNEFSDGAIWKDSQGYLYFGGIYGLNYFLPQDIRENTRQPNLVLAGLQFAGKPLNPDGYLVLRADRGTPENYAVHRNDNFFELELRALSFMRAEKCEYTWQLAGHDKIWHYAGTNGKISYSNIPPGNYTLLVKWSNGEGVWTTEQVAFHLHVKPYFWMTWPAFLGYALLLFAGGYLFYKNRKNKLEIRHHLKLEQKLREKDEALHQERLNFFTNIAHELQTPLTLIMGSAERFQHHDQEQGPAKKRSDLLSILYQQASRLTYLVQQLLEFRKAEAGHLQAHYNTIDVSALLGNLTELFVPLSEQLGITFERQIPDGLTVTTDRDKLEKILFNLLSNAFKHSGKHEHIMMGVRFDADQQLLQLTVANSGCELGNDELERMFTKFQTGNKTNADRFSTGIGLAFTKQLVNLLGGNISASIDQGWITFQFDIPIPAQQAPNELPADGGNQSRPSFLYQNMTAVTSSEPALATTEYNKIAMLETLTEAHKKTILLVEDEPGIRYLLRDILKDQYVLYEAGDGLEAVAFIKKQAPDLIISDVMMPGMDGLTLCNKVKNTPATCHIPFIILSAKGAMEQRTEGYEVGADAYIAKPFHSSHLRIRVKNLFEQQQRLHQLFKQTDIGGIPASIDREHGQFLSALVQVIEQQLDNPMLNASMLEEALALSKMQLYRKLKTISSMTPAEFIRHIRLQHATKLLSTTQLTVAEIFYRTGFNNQSYFFREFKKQYHCSPNEYRSRQYVQV
ncbi:two-component regulator propeller domain-containing protein [Parapedobacter tibetensis]|uniref:two-component regulator propeller domain-containing protein n=1 Tax=Parapedobacter tibetensis TaxID=2972951 RepID=UPI00214D309E|nr:two-component regulator propeller domain-containing protein [Parapedobacter tibetensis]